MINMVMKNTKNVAGKVLLISVIFGMIISCYTSCLANNQNTVTNDFKIVGQTIVSGTCTYEISITENDEEIKRLSIDAAKYNLPSGLSYYDDAVRLRVTYSKDNYEIIECKVLNFETKEIVEDTSTENINKIFNIEYGKNIVEKRDWGEQIKLSELNENEVFKCIADEKKAVPEIINDLNENCIVYTKDEGDNAYKKEFYMHKNIDGNSISFNTKEYDVGDYFYIIYQKVGNDRVLNMVDEEDIIKLSSYKDGDKLEYKFHKLIYNDTDKMLTINTKQIVFEQEFSNTYTIEKNEICGFDWMIDEAIISYSVPANDSAQEEDKNNSKNTNTENENKTVSGNTNNENKTNSVNNKTNTTANKMNNNKTTAVSNKENSQTSQKIPETGANDIIFFIIFIAIIFALARFKKYYDLDKDMK